MHVAQDVRPALFDVDTDGRPAAWNDVLQRWDAASRFAIVVREPFGALGASLLIQLAALAFYEERPERRSGQYPQSYLIHVGGSHGDHSNYDFWPARHEIVVPDDPYEVLGVLNDRGITHVAVPEGIRHPSDDYVLAAASGWTDRAAARERLRDTLVYAAGGHADDADVHVSAADHDLEKMAGNTLDVSGSAAWFEGLADDELLALEIGPSSVADLRTWTRLFRERSEEIPADLRRTLADDRARTRLQAGRRCESYRRIAPGAALQYL